MQFQQILTLRSLGPAGKRRGAQDDTVAPRCIRTSEKPQGCPAAAQTRDEDSACATVHFRMTHGALERSVVGCCGDFAEGLSSDGLR
jgi:hypothetical protein